MVVTVDVHEAKTHLAQLLERVRLGEEIVIAKGGEPVARLVPEWRPRRRRPGSAKGKIVIHDAFYDDWQTG